MPPFEFSVFANQRFLREYRSLLKGHHDLPDHYAAAIDALTLDPYNATRRYPIKKLEGVSAGDGQYRFRSGRFRFRYDIDGKKVFLKGCALRRENKY